ncbi:MAG: hypothetical protein AAF845_14790 [Bacteroidota bacterium]
MLRYALASLAFVASAAAQDATLVATFDRTTTYHEATQTLLGLNLDPVPGGVRFGPVRVGVGLDVPLSAEGMDALFASGAISVEVVRSAAQFAALAPRLAEAGLEEISLRPRYHVRITYPSDTPSGAAAERATRALGVAPSTIEKRANEVRVQVPRPEAATVASRLGDAPGVVGVRIE